MLAHNLDHTLYFHLLKRLAGQRSIDAQAVNQDGRRDELRGRDFLHKLIHRLLVKVDGVVGLVLDFSFGPLLHARNNG